VSILFVAVVFAFERRGLVTKRKIGDISIYRVWSAGFDMGYRQTGSKTQFVLWNSVTNVSLCAKKSLKRVPKYHDRVRRP